MIYVFRHPPVVEEVVADEEGEARRIASYYHEGCQPEEWELVDVRGQVSEQRHGQPSPR